MRKTFKALLAGAVLAGMSSGAWAETKLRITLQLPLKSHLGQNLLLFKQEVEKNASDLKVEIYDSAQLYKDKQVPQAVGSGAIEMGVASLTRFVGEVPAVDIFYQPFMFNSEDLVRKATAKGSSIRGPIDDAILKTGSRVLWWQAYGGAIMLSKGGDVASPAAIKDRKVRVFGKTLGKFVKAAGGKATLMSGSKQYLAYKLGTVDVGMTGVSGVKSRKLWDVMDTITVTNHADIEFIVIVNEKFWQGLTDQQRNVITAAADKADLAVRNKVSEIEKDAFDAAKKNGMKVVVPTDAQLAEWRKTAAPVLAQYKKDAGALGEQLLKAAEEMRN